ncbi:MAG: methylenetetrahydrofolate reductase [NAD(P)H] [Burkholderiaceae bacterium]|nr:methylenetetrahydrofolate reductase [NAD(P)H] [Burkholderiaceae bacterium]
MKVTEHIRTTTKTLFSIEILPPLKGRSIKSIYELIDPLMEFKPPFVDVTYHREEYIYKIRDGGYLEKIAIRKRPGTVGICSAIINRYKTDAVPHIICGGFTCEETENALIELNYLGIDNVLLLRGDPIKTETHFTPDPGGNNYALDLVKQVSSMNKGKFLDDDLKDVDPANFCIGVAGYPEKHFEAPSMSTDLRYLKMKIEAGAEYIVTQMFFDNKKFFRFVENCREAGIDVPIIPGLKPLTSKKQMTLLPKTFHIDIPDDLVKEIESCKTDDAVKEAGIEWCVHQSRELMKNKIPCLHYYTMSNAGVIKKIASQVF